MRAIILATCLACAACAMTPTQRREETLTREARAFNDDLRWGRYEQVNLSLPAEEAALLAARAAALGDDLVIGDYEVTSITFVNGSEAATVVVKFDWYSKRDSILHSSTLEQRWEDQSGRWLVTKQRRLRGDRFPLIPEPVPPPPPVRPPAP
jgi:hypothetical protein